ncbi:hypothetical protein ILUMI_07798 [Ignelater luminosus]|uniref:Uncharacterized protein n=1 Tax=Ignelater luminosus TaxID=2038154 RepID=A0A8K0GBA1_IGNLU|nr:hypothetical protein ILUMI_07798 [Ignelater luminosus]
MSDKVSYSRVDSKQASNIDKSPEKITTRVSDVSLCNVLSERRSNLNCEASTNIDNLSDKDSVSDATVDSDDSVANPNFSESSASSSSSNKTSSSSETEEDHEALQKGSANQNYTDNLLESSKRRKECHPSENVKKDRADDGCSPHRDDAHKHTREMARWTNALSDADITTTGVADLSLKSAHVERSRYAQEVWIATKIDQSPQFLYWDIVIELESLLLCSVMSIRTSHFQLFVHALEHVCPWTFALDALHYSRWLSVFVRTLQDLSEPHPYVYLKFCSGHFTSSRTSQLMGEFEENLFPSGKRIQTLPKHHENTKAFDDRFRRHVDQLIAVLNDQGVS